MTSPLWMLISFISLASLNISVIALIYIAYRHIETIESQLINCKLAQGNRSLYSNAGILGKCMRLCMIAGMLSTPDFYIRRNLADPIEIQSTPEKPSVYCYFSGTTSCYLFFP